MTRAPVVWRVVALPALVLLLFQMRSPGQEFDEISPAAAESLASKIAAVQAAESDSTRIRGADSLEVGEVEMESFVLYWMEEEIPPRVESIDVVVKDGVISAQAELTFDEENRTGNLIVDTLFSGTHRFYAEGALRGAEGRGEFQLRLVRVDELTVPLVVIDVLVARFVTPQYPDVDLDEPFALPWGVDEIRLVPGRAEIKY